MGFQRVAFSPPPSVGNLSAGLAPALDGLKSGLAQGATSLQGLGLPPSGPGELAAQMAAARQAATAAVESPANFMAITPFQYGIGIRKGEYAYLTSEQALAALVGRMGDAWAKADTSEELAIVALVVSSVSHAAMSLALAAFNQVFPIPQLEKICRRASALATLETDKFLIPNGPGYPAWGQTTPRQTVRGQEVAKALGGLLAACEGAGMATASPAEKLAVFAQKQAQKLADKAASLQTLSKSMKGGNDAWAGFSIHAPGPALFRYLENLAAPFDEASKCTSLLCWFGKPHQVAYYRESFGLCRRTLTNTACLTCTGENTACPF